MSTEASTKTNSKGMTIAGWIVGGLPAIFFIINGAIVLTKPAEVVKAMTEMGFPESAIAVIGGAMLGSAVVYLIPQTAVLGAILCTGYLGGAVATHVHAGDDVTKCLMPVFFGILFWVGLWLRDARVRALAPIRS